MPATYTQANQPIEIITPLGKDVLLITGFHGDEGISRLFHFQIDMVADVTKTIAFDQLLGQKIAVRLNLATKPRYFAGICIRFSQGEADADFCTYQMEMAPAFWLWTKVAQTRTFQQQAVPDILKTVLKGLDVTYQLSGTYSSRNYCVQYRETDFNFACRLMEEEGIFFFFTHTSSGHTMVVADSSSSHPELPLGSKLTFQKNVQDHWAENFIHTWHKQQELLTGNFTLWDHCFQMTGKNLQAKGAVSDTVQMGTVKHSLKSGNAGSREIYDYPGDYALRFDGVDPGGGDRTADYQKLLKDNDRTVAIRQQQEAVRGIIVHGTSTCRNLVSGNKFTLQNHPNANGDYLLTAVQHQVVGTIDYRTAKGEFRYVNSFTAMAFAVPFRPQRLTPKPFVQGTQTATVVGPSGQEIFTDKFGRVKVQFNWDRVGTNDAKSSCWVRVAQVWAGKRWGATFWPRIGQEVIVAFLEGNPDWPIIVGSVYNDQQMPPYLGDGPDSNHPKDNKVTGIKSNSTTGGQGFNEWRFDDTAGKEQFFIHAQFNMDTRVLNDSMLRVFGNSHVIVGWKGQDPDTGENKSGGDLREMVYQDRHIDIKRDQIEKIEGNHQFTVGNGDAQNGGNVDINIQNNKTESIGKDSQLNIQGGLTEQIAKDQAVTVQGNFAESIGKACNITVSSDRNESVGGNQSLNVSKNQIEQVGQNHVLQASQNIYLKGGTNVVIEAATQLTLKVGGNFVVIDSSGVSIVGTMVNINSGGSAGSGSGSSPTSPTAPAAPTDAKVAAPTAPTLADDSKTGAKSASG